MFLIASIVTRGPSRKLDKHRLHTSYEHVNYATTEQLLSELSGGVPLQLNLSDYTSNPHALLDELVDLTTRMCIITAYNDGSVRCNKSAYIKCLCYSSKYPQSTHYNVKFTTPFWQWMKCVRTRFKQAIMQTPMQVELLNSRKVSLIRLRCAPGTTAVTGPWTRLDDDAWNDVKSIADCIRDAQASNIFWLL